MVTPAPDLDLLRTFAVFAAQLNFTRAAALLHLSQPAVHAQVARLGESLGVALYQRQGRALALTDDGRRVAAFARETSERTEAFVAALRGDEAPRPVCLCAGAGSYVHLLGEALRGWIAGCAAPTRLLTRDREGTLEAVRSGEAHLGVAPVEARRADLSAEVLGVIPQVLAMPAAHPLAGRRSVRLRDLDGVRLVAPSPDRPHRQALDAALAAGGARAEVAVEANGWELTLRFVELCVGAAVVSGFCRLPPGVVARPMPELPAKTYHLVRRRKGARRPEQEALRQALLAGCATWRR
ncbi:MAG: LysR family transcriptional regulator [Deltaproteobacteria bacterium]|jgi:DNA-binding transcriptional LysR family regulator|nr:LysR family transcriptional regulator [Deltaproteobacteria bacterium]MBP6833940.1 LysR family transcriptional regulator [Deltaproteobacteria bacterium]